MAEIDWASILKETLGGFALAELPPTLKLPALPHAVTLYVQKSEDPKVAIKELAKIIETDTGLTLELLRYVNSAFIGLRHKAQSVQQVLSLLGQRQSKTFIITTGMQAAVQSKKSKLINQNSFWNASLQKALFAKEVAGLLKTDTDVAFAGGLLQDYLLPVLSNDLFDKYFDFVQNRDEKPGSLSDFEHSSFGWDHALAGAGLAHRWHLPDDLVCCILFQHQGLKILAHPQLGRSSAAAVALSALLPDQLRQSENGIGQLVKLEEKWKVFDIRKLAETVDQQQEEMGFGIKNDFPLSRRCEAFLNNEAPANEGILTAAAST